MMVVHFYQYLNVLESRSEYKVALNETITIGYGRYEFNAKPEDYIHLDNEYDLRE